VTLGAGATVLGDVIIGRGATVGAGAVVTRPVPPRCTVVGVNKVLPPRRTTTTRDKPGGEAVDGVKRSTGHTHSHTTAEQTTLTNTELATAHRRVDGVNKVLPPRRTSTARDETADRTALLHGRDGLLTRGGDMLTLQGHSHPSATVDTTHNGTPPALRSDRTTIEKSGHITQAGAGPMSDSAEVCRVSGAASAPQGDAVSPARPSRLPRSRL